MKYIALFSILYSFNSFAIDFQKVTGTFEVEQSTPVMGQDTVAQAAFGTYELVEGGRFPASVEESDAKVSSVTEITGTFK